jgi:hypothetical protein
MVKLRCYYAHTMTSYNSTIEKQDIELLESLGFEVINPNQKKYQEGCKKYSEIYDWDKVMVYFCNVIREECDMVAFRSLPNGKILSGVAAEVKYARQINYPIIELPCSLEQRYMEYPETKQYLIELGHYKV